MASGRTRQTTLAIRPEHIELLNASAENTVPGIVKDLIYKGEFTEYRIAVVDTIVRVKALQGSLGYRPGDAVHIQFPAEKLFEVT